MSLKVADLAQVREPSERWTTSDAAEMYDVASWGKGYFSVGENGNLFVHPTKELSRKIDLKQLVDTLEWRGISLPILIRFAEILKHRLGELHRIVTTRSKQNKRNKWSLGHRYIDASIPRKVAVQLLH